MFERKVRQNTDSSLTRHCLWQAMNDLDWKPEFGLIDGLTDSYQKDFGRGTFRKEPDFSVDDAVLAQFKK